MYRLLLLCACLAPALAFYDKGDVQVLTPSNFDRLVVNSDDIWIVEFYAPWCGHCKNLIPEYTKLASALKGVVKVGAVDADEHRSLGGQFGVEGFPTILIFGSDKKKPTKYAGGRTAQAMAEAVLAKAKEVVNERLGGKKSSGGSKSSGRGDGDVIELTDANFDKLVLQSEDVWLVEFFAPWCGHCKSLEPHWKQAARDLKGKVKLGALNADMYQSKSQEYGVRGFPTIKFFPAGKKSSSSAEEYNGGRTSGEIVTWALDKYGSSAPAPELIELVSEEASKAACEDKSLCIVSILPHILDCDAKCRNEYLTILRDLGEQYKKQNWGWVWTEGGQQPLVEEALELGGSGYPTMAAVNYKKLKYTPLRLSFSKQGIHEFLRDISYGKGSTAPVRGAAVPKVLNIDAWDGKDGQLPVEDDIDLSDVDLDDLSEAKDEL